MEERGLNHFAKLFNLLLATTNIAVRHIWLLLHLHHGHGGVDLGGQGDVDLVLVTIHTEKSNERFMMLGRHHMYEKITRDMTRDCARHITVKVESVFGGKWL